MFAFQEQLEKMMDQISPRVDLVFKKLFGVEENKDLLISLINSIVSSEDHVKDVTLLNPYNLKNFAQDKLSILDVKAVGENGKRYNIEIQISDEADYDKRALYYWAKLYTEQLKAGEDYGTLSKAIGIHILNFTSILNAKKYHNVFYIREKETGLAYFKDLELHTIELKKFSENVREDLKELAKKVKTSLDMWVAFLTRHDLLKSDKLPKKLDDPALKKALSVLQVMNFAPQERDTYEEHLKWLQVEANTLRKYESKGFEKGHKKGKEEGREEGREEGIEIGELRKAKDMALKMLKNKISLEDISDFTGLPMAEISSLQDLDDQN